jgi:hypothetical protein
MASGHFLDENMKNIIQPYGPIVYRYLPIRSLGMVVVWLALSVFGFYIADCLVLSIHQDHLDFPASTYFFLTMSTAPIVAGMQSVANFSIEASNKQEGQRLAKATSDVLIADGFEVVESTIDRVVHRRRRGIFASPPLRRISDIEIIVFDDHVQVIGLRLLLNPLYATLKERRGGGFENL